MTVSVSRADDSPSELSSRVTAVVVPVGMAVFSWLALLLLAGYLLRLDGVSPLDVVPLFVFGLMLWPLTIVRPWREDATPRILAWVSRNRATLALTGALAIVVAVEVVSGLLATILGLPFRASGMLFGASLFYRARVGDGFGWLLFRFGQWYLEVLWLYVFSGALVTLGRKVR